MKRLNYESVQISTLGGIIACSPSTDGWRVTYTQRTDQPRSSYGKSIEEASQQLIDDLKYTLNAIEEDLRAFVERNK